MSAPQARAGGTACACKCWRSPASEAGNARNGQTWQMLEVTGTTVTSPPGATRLGPRPRPGESCSLPRP